jgi:hypothetical protein
VGHAGAASDSPNIANMTVERMLLRLPLVRSTHEIDLP